MLERRRAIEATLRAVPRAEALRHGQVRSPPQMVGAGQTVVGNGAAGDCIWLNPEYTVDRTVWRQRHCWAPLDEKRVVLITQQRTERAQRLPPKGRAWRFGGRVGDVEDPKSGLAIQLMVYGELSIRVPCPP